MTGCMRGCIVSNSILRSINRFSGLRSRRTMRSGLRVVVFGILGHIPLAGIAWQALHYLEGFRRLSCAVIFFGVTGVWPSQPKGNVPSEVLADTLTFMACGLAG